MMFDSVERICVPPPHDLNATLQQLLTASEAISGAVCNSPLAV